MGEWGVRLLSREYDLNVPKLCAAKISVGSQKIEAALVLAYLGVSGVRRSSLSNPTSRFERDCASLEDNGVLPSSLYSREYPHEYFPMRRFSD